MRGYRKTAAPTAIGSGGKDDTKRGDFLSHVSSKKAIPPELYLWPTREGQRWGVLAVGDSGGGMVVEDLPFRFALAEALRLSADSRDFRDAPIMITPRAAAELYRHTVGGSHAGN